MNKYNLRDSNDRNRRQQTRVLQSIKNSWSKTEKNIINTNTMYKKTKAIRPLLLNIIRHYDVIKHEWAYARFFQVLYKKSVKWANDIDEEFLSKHARTTSETNYIKSFKKNLTKIKKICEDTSITYYLMLPDRFNNDIRTHCIQFISQAAINR